MSSHRNNTATAGPGVRQVLSELDVAALASRITDPQRTRPVVVVTSGSRAAADRLDVERIATALGPEVEVATLPTGSLTYALERGLPEDTHVFGDAARTYPVGIAWQTRPHLSVLRFCRADTDARRVEAQVVADARAAARHAAQAPAHDTDPGHSRTVRVGSVQGPHVIARPAGRMSVTPAMLPGAPPRQPSAPSRSNPSPPAAPTLTAAGPSASPPAAPTAAGQALAGAPTAGPTPTQPRGAPTRPIPGSARASRVTPAPPGRRRLAESAPWHARSDAEGRALAAHLVSARALPVLVVTTPTETSGPLMDAEDLQRRVGEIADVVVLHNGPASWALAHAMPAMTQVYGGAGRVYPIDLGWLTNPYRAPIRFCWPGDDPRQVADQLEDDAFGAANLDGLTATRTAAAPIQALGTVKGFVGRHHAVLALNRGGDSLLLVDQLYPGVEPGRLLRPGQALSGQIDRAASIPAFQPDPVDDDPHARVASAYATGDVVLARVTEVSARSGQALLHPKVTVPVLAGDDESDLRTLVAVDDVVTLTLTFGGGGALAAELADSDAASVPCLPVLPGGPPWLVEADLPAQMPSPEPPSGQPEAEAAEQAGASAAAAAAAAVPPLSPATIGQHAQIAGLSAQVNSLTTLLDRQSQETARQARAARLAREEVQRLRRRVKSLTDQHQAHRDRVEGTALFSDPEQQLRFDIEQTWLRRTPEAERSDRPLHAYQVGPEFLNTLARLQGIRRDKVLDVLVEVLTDRARDIPGRELHPLREAEASQVQLVRGDGAKAWRCALQVNTPSARRLHYWRLPDGTLELDSVGTHDQGL